MANLTEDVFDIIDDELKAFSYLSPQKKASAILQDFKNSKVNDEKMTKAKSHIEEELYDFHRMRLYTKAQREISMLNEDEMNVYLSLLFRQIEKDLNAEKTSSFGKMLDKLSIYNSAIFLLVEHMDGEDIIKPKLKVGEKNEELLYVVTKSLNDLKEKICDIDMVM